VTPVRTLHVDRHVVVVDKPTGIPTVPFDEAERRSLVRIVSRELRGQRLHVVQRLDAGTSGVLVFARTELAREVIKAQLRTHSVEREYLAVCHGRIDRPTTLRSFLVADRGDRRRGSARGSDRGRLAVTHVEPRRPLGGATLVACRLETGRTHQIRIHLAEAGHPLLGERVYVKGFERRPLPAPRLALHAHRLAFDHPEGGRRMTFVSPLPPDLVGLIGSLCGSTESP
jgi:23S rRNA pseudouridine1911/1915/1917 synthase